MKWPLSLLLSFAAAVSGCAALQSPRPDPVEPIVAEAVRLIGAAGSEQRQVLEASRMAVERARSAGDTEALDAALVRRGVLLGALAGPTQPQAISQAIALMEPVARRAPDQPLGRFAALHVAALRDREQLAAALRTSQERAVGADDRTRAANERANVATERVNLLRQQLDALKSAERGILEREEKMRALKR